MKKQQQLDLLEKALVSTGHKIRYEKGSFVGGDCRVKENMIVVVNKFLPIEGKIATLAAVLRKINPPALSPDVVKIIDTVVPTNLFSRENI
ncbi:MAG TPA: hypothetical protein DEB17_11275 [Chlorobaculum sp.]|uniref:Uncharacterized protein n=1 Tax=Chlorobaculum tepidum (strain ATCC 49652 / DSM 12025 / NBRC 103806 / TLS) TaxID=194439 RepID=Q8KCP7_CHLTE|nr:hypothetical protein [Chlorobaculum tepidum]AAM72595.1 hypothetical protein CT1366 [Chlorobaculum tepidum TLS]HBU24547.1 hypothetical protein [Chlorobaculum sp.]